MSVVPPLGYSSWTRYAADSYATAQHLAMHVGRLQRHFGRLPVIYFHDYLADGDTTLDGAYEAVFGSIAQGSYPVLVPRLVSNSQWANPAVVDAGGAVDDAIEWAHDQPWIETREDRVAVYGVGMGSLNALNWAWRNPGRVAAVVLVAPIVDADAFYTDNPGRQAAINTAWGSGAAWTAALPDIDPMQNLDLVRPFGHKIAMWYGASDTEIDPNDVHAFAQLVGARTPVEFEGTASTRHLAPSDQVAVAALDIIRNRARAYVGWDERDIDRFYLFPITLPPVDDPNVNDFRTGVWPGGRRGEFHRVSGNGGNERHGAMLGGFSAADAAVGTTWFQQNGGLMVGQHGQFIRGEAGADGEPYLLPMAWGDIFGVSPWIVNMGGWGGTVGGNDLALLGNLNATIPGLRLSAGGEVLASQRIGGVVTLVLEQADLDRNFRSRTLDVDISGPLGDHLIIGAERISATEVAYAQAGADIPNGGAGSWADFASCYPFRADTDMIGTTMRGRFYPLGMDPPAFDDPDWSMDWTAGVGQAPTGYGGVGLMFGHVGTFDGEVPHNIQVGAFTADER